MSTALWIEPDGTVEAVVYGPRAAVASDPLHIAAVRLGTPMTSVVSARCPDLGNDLYGDLHVLVIDDWGLDTSRPLNRKAWALYGRSPIYGPALFYRDDHAELSAKVQDMVMGDWPPAELLVVMDDWLDAHPDYPR